jgi:two-component system, NarL family, sensor histidine kinase UhpB
VSAKRRSPSSFRPLRQLAENRVATKRAVALDVMTPDEIRALVHELEIHKVELEIQNEQLNETQNTLEQAKEHYRRLYESAPVGYLTLNSDAEIVDTNLTASMLLRRTRSRLIGRKLSRFIAPPHQDRWHLERRILAQGTERRSLELDFELPDGSLLHAQLVGSGALETGDAAGTLRLGLLDVTELRSLARALRAAAVETSLAEERQRRALAADLHDDAGQLLTLASLKLRALADKLGKRASDEIRGLSELLAETRRRVSSLSFELSPPLLHDVGLVAAAEWLAERKQQRYGLVVHIAKVEEPALDEATRVTLFRALRELLVNVAKHASVAEGHVRIWRDGDLARLSVEDAGVGFDPEADHRGFGLLALRDRVAQMGGSVEIESAVGRGTRIVVSVPIASRDADAEGGST